MSLGSLERFPQVQINLWRLYKHFYPLKSAVVGKKQKFLTKMRNETTIRVTIEEFEKILFVRSGLQEQLKGDYIKRITKLLHRTHVNGVEFE